MLKYKISHTLTKKTNSTRFLSIFLVFISSEIMMIDFNSMATHTEEVRELHSSFSHIFCVVI